MTLITLLSTRLKQLRQQIGLSQEAVGAQGFVSTPGYIKIENGQRQPSDKLVGKLVDWLVAEKHVQKTAATALREELLLRKYLQHSSEYVRGLARLHAAAVPWGQAIVAELKAPARKVTRGRPAVARTKEAVVK